MKTSLPIPLQPTRRLAIDWYKRKLRRTALEGPDHLARCKRWLALGDLFFLLVFLLNRKDANRDFVFDRCREVQASPDGHLDLWAREHFKSTIVTQALTIRDILTDPEVTFGFFSFNRPVAKAFLRVIKVEFETNEELKALFPDVLYTDPKSEAPKWSEDDGIIVKRRGNPKESTIEAWGLVDGQPTSKHFRKMVYDDIVTEDTVTTPEMMQKATRAWENSNNLMTEDGVQRYVGTRWHFNDPYKEIMDRGAAAPRIHACTLEGEWPGTPAMMSYELLADKRRKMGLHVFGAQMLLDPTADKAQGFNSEWLRYYKTSDGWGMNKYLLVDPASAKKKHSDYTAMVVIGLAPDLNYYILDMVRDRLSLTERASRLFELHRRWKPHSVGYEKIGMQADVEHIKDRQERDNYRFDIVELGGTMAKNDRIRRLVPLMEQHRLWLPESLHRTDHEGKMHDLVHDFVVEEVRAFPVGLHDDMLDACARILDEDMTAELTWPKEIPAAYDRDKGPPPPRRRSWMSG